MNEKILKFHRPLQDYIQYFEKLNKRSIRLIEKLAEPGIMFKDPFNDVQGIEAFEAIFEHMFATVQNPKFKVRDYAWGQAGNIAYLRWGFTYVVKGKPQRIEGMSEIMFSESGKIMSHIDHWDAAENLYEKIPLLGGAIRFVKSKLAV